MKIYNRENQLPLRHSGYSWICPNCGAEYADEGLSKHTITCPNCGYHWRVQINGHPKTEAAAQGGIR